MTIRARFVTGAGTVVVPDSVLPIGATAIDVATASETFVPAAFASTFDGLDALGSLVRTLIFVTDRLDQLDADPEAWIESGERVVSAYSRLKAEESRTADGSEPV
jgi:hypothetical protein